MGRRIVVGSDGSGRASEAVRQAVELAKGIEASLIIVRAYPESVPHDPGIAYEPTLAEDPEMAQLPADVPRPVGPRAAAMASLEQEVAAAVRAGLEDVTSVARPGDPANAIISVAEDMDADLIVVGNKGMTGPARFVLGSVPDKITHHAPCSVLVAHTG
jgi:nucleotide-binding universal stress UspA family protein